MNKLPPTYTVQDGCHNCEHAVADYCGLELQFRCGFGSPNRPSSPLEIAERIRAREDQLGRLLSPEEFRLERDVELPAWLEWSRGREVVRCGKCEHHRCAED